MRFQLRFRIARQEKTALVGLIEIRAGCHARWDGRNLAIKARWRPAQKTALGLQATIEEHADLLRSRIQLTVCTMGRHWRKALIGISGGLDSSIVAASCLSAGIDFDCLTLYGEHLDDDERIYSRALANFLHKPLIECPFDLDDVHLAQSSVAPLPRPIGWSFQQAIDAAYNRVAADHGVDVILRGTGGDAVFNATHSAAPIVDAFAERGPGQGLRTMLDVCRLHGCSLGTAARFATRKLLHALRPPAFKADDSLLLPSDTSEAVEASYPWENGAPAFPPGRREHLRMIGAISNFFEARLALNTEVACPLFSQPVIETALSIPSWQWVSGGINRAVARLAYDDRLPDILTRRRTKGSVSGFVAKLVHTRHREIEEILMDGLLAANGVIDRERVHEKLVAGSTLSPIDQVRLLSLVDTEAWAQHWSERSRRRAAVSAATAGRAD